MLVPRVTFVLILTLFIGQSAEAQCKVHQTYKLLADDGEADDCFGQFVAISGTTAIVAATDHDGAANASGAVYLFDTTTGQQIAELVADDAGVGDEFGFTVATSGTTVIIGAPFNDNINGNNSGAAYLFDITSGQQIAKLLPDDGAPGDEFGTGVSISGTTAIVGAPDDDDNGADSGSAYVFDTTTGQQIWKLLPDDGAADDRWGFIVGISGTTAIVGVHRDDDNGADSGSAYLFNTTTGQQVYKLLPNDGAAGDQFGRDVGISGTTAIIGAFRNDDNGFNSGSAYLFDITTGQQIHKLLPDDGEEQDHFGEDVSINGTTAIVSAHNDDDNGTFAGSAYLFNTSTGQQIAKLLADDGEADDNFGSGVSISGTTAIVGAWHDNGTGSAYLFDVGSCGVVIGDVNLDGVVNLLDVAPFSDLLTSGDFQAEADINQDGIVDMLDVQPFVDLLRG